VTADRVAIDTEEIWPADADEEGYVPNSFVREGRPSRPVTSSVRYRSRRSVSTSTDPGDVELVEFAIPDDAAG
jgi:hypothetical protein